MKASTKIRNVYILLYARLFECRSVQLVHGINFIYVMNNEKV
jgi:hypothetical protein